MIGHLLINDISEFSSSLRRKAAFLLLAAFAAVTASARWYAGDASGGLRRLHRIDGTVSVEAAPGRTSLFFDEPERKTFRPDAEREARFRKFLRLDVRSKPESASPVELRLFVKDKDGLFFQTRRSWQLEPGAAVTLEAALSGKGLAWECIGGRAEWSVLEAATIFSPGVTVVGGEGVAHLELGEFHYEGDREYAAPELLNWELSESPAVQNRMLESRFELSQEYFNPFDPREVSVDVEVTPPSAGTTVFPAFFTRDYIRKLENGVERVEPLGRPYWAFRYTPQEPGQHRVKIMVRDSRGGALESRSRVFSVRRSRYPGFVRRAAPPSKFFRFDNGGTFYPVGLNIHTVTDLRAEERFKKPPQPDHGTFSYDGYLELCAKSGINAVELWMASWGFAIEWSSRRDGFYGMGRYNLAQAWRLDHVLKRGGDMGIYFQLVLDNHGKMTPSVDQEWHENPVNRNSDFAAADGGTLENPGDFFDYSDPSGSRTARYYAQRNRYIAARWGAQTAIFGVELWSEIDLTAEFKVNYEDENIMLKWLDFAAADFRKNDSGKHLITTHVCGDYRNNLTYRDMWLRTTMDYVAGDEYFGGSPNKLMVDMLRSQAAEDVFPQPWLVTEFGSPGGRDPERHVRGEIHSGLWGAFFLGLPGTPFLWWHDFALKSCSEHYLGFTTITGRFDRTDPAWQRLKMKVTGASFNVDSESIGKSDTVVGWLFRRQAMHMYPDSPEDSPMVENAVVEMDSPLRPGRYRIDFYDPVSAARTATSFQSVSDGLPLRFVVRPFRIDTVFIISGEGE